VRRPSRGEDRDSSHRVPRERIYRGARRSRVRSVSTFVASAGRTMARGAERRTRAAHVRAHRSLAGRVPRSRPSLRRLSRLRK
jgi:hypothetical protein